MDNRQWRASSDRGQIKHTSYVFGHSRKGNALEVYIPDSAMDARGLIIAGQHGDEADGTHLLSRALRLLPSGMLQCAAVLAANPDGLLQGTRGNANGVDLNRNFPASCWKHMNVKHKWLPHESQGVDLSTGDAPGSEPETLALLRLIDQLRPAWIISLHSPLACIDDALKSPLAYWLSEKTKLPLVDTIGYATPGSFGQWCQENKQPLITLELPDALYHQDIEKVMRALLVLLQGVLPCSPMGG